MVALTSAPQKNRTEMQGFVMIKMVREMEKERERKHAQYCIFSFKETT